MAKQSKSQPFSRQYDYEDRTVVAIDVPGPREEVSVDITGDTAIITVESKGFQAELSLDKYAGRPESTVNNGVVTLEFPK